MPSMSTLIKSPTVYQNLYYKIEHIHAYLETTKTKNNLSRGRSRFKPVVPGVQLKVSYT